jgi:hypothetical protein
MSDAGAYTLETRDRGSWSSLIDSLRFWTNEIRFCRLVNRRGGVYDSVHGHRSYLKLCYAPSKIRREKFVVLEVLALARLSSV